MGSPDKRAHLAVLDTLTEAQAKAVEAQIATERAAAVEAARDRLANGAAVPVALSGLAIWMWALRAMAVSLGIAGDLVQWLLTGGTLGLFIGLVTLGLCLAVVDAAHWLMGGSRRG